MKTKTITVSNREAYNTQKRLEAFNFRIVKVIVKTGCVVIEYK